MPGKQRGREGQRKEAIIWEGEGGEEGQHRASGHETHPLGEEAHAEGHIREVVLDVVIVRELAACGLMILERHVEGCTGSQRQTGGRRARGTNGGSASK